MATRSWWLLPSVSTLIAQDNNPGYIHALHDWESVVTAQESTQQNHDMTREGSASAPTWEYGAPDLGLGPVTRPVQPVGSDDVVLDGVEG